MSYKKEVKVFHEACRQLGCRVVMRRNGHVAIHTPSGAVVYAAASPSDKRGFLEMKRDLRRYGVDLEKLREPRGSHKSRKSVD